MDELKDKFNSLFKPKPKKAGFKGQGHRLGNAEPTQPQPQAHPAAQASTSSQQRATLQQPHAAQHVSKVEPRQELKPATEFSPFTAVIGGGAACTTTKMNPAASPANNESAAAAQPGPSQQPPPPQPQQQAAPPVAQAEVSPSVLEEVQHCLALISSQPEAAAGSMEVLHKLLSNLMAAPQEAKFRQLRLGPDPNPKIQANILAVSGALDLLKACGFEVHEDSQDGGTFAYFLDDAKLSYVEAGLLQLQLVMSETRQTQQQQQQQSQGQQQSQPLQAAAVTSAASSSLSSAGLAAPASQPPAVPQAVSAAPVPKPAPAVQPPVARNTLVLLPAAPDADVPDWFFQRTAAEVKAEFTALLRRRQAQQVVASKAWKDLKLGAGSSAGSKQPSVITLRVRFPEGVCLQGCFGVREAVTAVFDWVTGSLRYPGLTYELITPNRSPLGSKGSVGAADLAGAVLHFRGLSNTQRGGYLVDERGRQLPFLSDGLLAQAQAD